jgi:hypothetical protein
MHARLTVYENVDLDLNDRLTAFMEGLDGDPFSDLPGYRGSMTLLDRGSARLIGIGLYDDEDQARAVDSAMANPPQEMIDALPEDLHGVLDLEPDTVAYYEVVART